LNGCIFAAQGTILRRVAKRLLLAGRASPRVLDFVGHDPGQPIAQATHLAVIAPRLIFREKGDQSFLGGIFGICWPKPKASSYGQQDGPITTVKFAPYRIVGAVLEAFEEDCAGACGQGAPVSAVAHIWRGDRYAGKNFSCQNLPGCGEV
jgi:hypothetical protein